MRQHLPATCFGALIGAGLGAAFAFQGSGDLGQHLRLGVLLGAAAGFGWSALRTLLVERAARRRGDIIDRLDQARLESEGLGYEPRLPPADEPAGDPAQPAPVLADGSAEAAVATATVAPPVRARVQVPPPRWMAEGAHFSPGPAFEHRGPQTAGGAFVLASWFILLGLAGGLGIMQLMFSIWGSGQSPIPQFLVGAAAVLPLAAMPLLGRQYVVPNLILSALAAAAYVMVYGWP